MKHTDADLALAAHVAECVGADDLYVAWSHEHGPGEVPEVEAVVRDDRPVSAFAEVLVAACAGLVALWQTITSRPVAGAPRAAAPRAAA